MSEQAVPEDGNKRRGFRGQSGMLKDAAALLQSTAEALAIAHARLEVNRYPPDSSGCSPDGIACRDEKIQQLERKVETAEKALETLRLLKDMDAIEVSALATFIRDGDIPETIENARLALVKRMLAAQSLSSRQGEALRGFLRADMFSSSGPGLRHYSIGWQDGDVGRKAMDAARALVQPEGGVNGKE